MQIPIKVAVRICPPDLHLSKIQPPHKEKCPESGNTDSESGQSCEATVGSQVDGRKKFCVQPITQPITPPPGVPPALIQVGPHAFPVHHALPLHCTQKYVYHETVQPMMAMFVEGFDASVVTYGQRGCGKTYSLYGKGFGDAINEADHGIVAHFVREVFTHIGKHPERTYTVNITWIEVCREIIKDLFGVGSVQCMSMSDVFHWLQMGYKLVYNSKLQIGHSLFSLTLEQRWVSKEGLIQHRLSTASFTDLGPTERIFMLRNGEQPTGPHRDLGLQSLEQVVNILANSKLLLKFNGKVPYNQTVLSALLKDSFGGRAQTLVLVCVSPWEKDVEETLWNMQFAFKVQLVKNLVVVNAYSDDNTPVPLETIKQNVSQPKDDDNFGLQFAAKQWFKLVANAEELLKKLMSSTAIPQAEKQQIGEWLLKKQEFEECLNSGEISNSGQICNSGEAFKSDKSLAVIHEVEEPDDVEDSSSFRPETALRVNSDNGAENVSENAGDEEHVEVLMQNLMSNTDELVRRKYKEFMQNHPKSVTESLEAALATKKHRQEDVGGEERRSSAGNACGGDGRRRSLIPKSTISSTDLVSLTVAASRDLSDSDESKENQELYDTHNDLLDKFSDVKLLKKKSNSRLEYIQKKLRILETDIEAKVHQVREIKEIIRLKQNMITELSENRDTIDTVRQRFNKKRNKLEGEYEKSKKYLTKAVTQKKDKNELERLTANITRLEQRLKDITSINDIAGEGEDKLKQLLHSKQEYKNLMESLQKKVKKERKLKRSLTAELKSLQENSNCQALVEFKGRDRHCEEKRKNLQGVRNRIANLNHVLQEKSDDLNLNQSNKQRESLRHEIRNLRKTRDHLIEQRYSLDCKLKHEKSLSLKEGRKLLECEEAIEAIDAAIEFKNELICGRKSFDTIEKLRREKGERMLMARLNKLSQEEMRTLIYKYFTKVIDLKESSHRLEQQLMELESAKDTWEWKERILSNSVQQANLEGEGNAVRLRRQHETKMALMLRNLAEDSGSSSGSNSDQSLAVESICQQPATLRLHSVDTTYSSYSQSEFEWSHLQNNKAASKLLCREKHVRDFCPATETVAADFKDFNKIRKRESKQSNSSLPAKLQTLTRFPSDNPSSGFIVSFPSSETQRRKDKSSPIKCTGEQLGKSSIDSANTKVERKNNKMVIKHKMRNQ